MATIKQINKQLERETFKRKYTYEITPEWKIQVKKSWGKHYGLFEVWAVLAGQNWLVHIYFENPDVAFSNGKFFLESKFSEIALRKPARVA